MKRCLILAALAIFGTAMFEVGVDVWKAWR